MYYFPLEANDQGKDFIRTLPPTYHPPCQKKPGAISKPAHFALELFQTQNHYHYLYPICYKGDHLKHLNGYFSRQGSNIKAKTSPQHTLHILD